MTPNPPRRSLNHIFLNMLWVQMYLPLLVISLLMVSVVTLMGSRSFQTQQISLTSSVVMTVNNYLRDASRILDLLSAHSDLADTAEIQESMDIIQSEYPYFNSFVFLNEEGRVLAASPNGNQYLGLDMSRQSYFQKAKESGGIVITQPFISLSTGHPAVHLAHALTGHGVIAGELNLNELQQIVASDPGLTRAALIFITDRSGIVLAHPRAELVAQQAYFGSLALIQEAHLRPTSQFYWENGVPVIGAAVSVPETGWVVASQSALAYVVAPLLWPTLTFMLLIGVTQAIFIRLFSRKFDHAISTPLGQLSQVTTAVASGNYTVQEQVKTIPQAFQEIAALANNFNEMTGSVLSREQALQRLASHDALTDLPNRDLLRQVLQQAIEHSLAGVQNATSSPASSSPQPFAVLFIDLDNFKTINDAFGHHTGDLTLQYIAALLLAQLGPDDSAGRLGGDEFAIVLGSTHSTHNAAILARQILEAINQPMYIEGHELYISASIGISFYPQDGSDPDTLIQNADTAMYKAKHEGKDTFQFYSQEMETQAQERHRISSLLHHAQENEEFELHFQPIYASRDHHIIGSEALMRWTNPQLGPISPDRFIPLAIETGLILTIGEWVLHSACTSNLRWLQQGYADLHINVNIAERQLRQPSFLYTLARVLEETGLPPRLLNLELTENLFYQDFKEINALLLEIKRLGVMLSLDDFGTGQGTLSVLTQIPFDEIKIDRRLSKNVTSDPHSAVIVQGIIQIASGLGKTVVAEGVETLEQVAYFEQFGIDLQGFYLSRPIPPTGFERLLKTEFCGRHAKKQPQ